MSLGNWPEIQSKTISQFSGSVQRLDAYSVPDGNGLYSANVSYVRGLCSTRFGHQVTFTDFSHGAITTMYNWFFIGPSTPYEQESLVVYYSPTFGVLSWAYPSGGFSGVLIPTTGASGASFVGAGNRLYAAFYDPTGRLSTYSGVVFGDLVGVDNLFAAPIQNTITAAETATGVVTAGLHQIGYVFTTRNGYTGKLCPVDSNGDFAPISFTSSGNKNLQLTIAGALPAYLDTPATPGGSVFQIVMSAVGSPATYYEVPGAFATCANPTVITININDYDLTATGTDFTAYQLLLTSALGGEPPFFPNSIFTYSSRMGYCTIDQDGYPVTYISEPNAYQYITADQHGLYLEGNQQTIVAFSLRGVCYMVTENTVYSVEDSGDVPVNWTPPQKVDGSIGVKAPTNITVNPSLGYAGIAADRGFYVFQGGIFPAKPLSYYQQPDWERVYWGNPTQIQVVDDQLNKRFIVLAPLTAQITAVSGTPNHWILTTNQNPTLYPNTSATIDGVSSFISGTLTDNAPSNQVMWTGTSAPSVGDTIYPNYATHQLTWDYTEGDTPEIVKYSLNSMANYAPAAMCTVINLPSALQEVWFAPSVVSTGAGGGFLRQCDGTELSNSYMDQDAASGLWAIAFIYETNLIPGVDDESATIHFYHGMHFRGYGTGQINITINGLDGSPSLSAAQNPYSPVQGEENLITWIMTSEQQSIRFASEVAGPANSNFTMSHIRAYYSEQFGQR